MADIGSAEGREWAPGWKGALQKRAEEGLGLFLVVGALLFWVALASWHADDPSFNSAGTGPARNLLGLSGAYCADIFFQTLGFAAAFLALPMIGWGVRLMRHDRLHPLPLRLLTWMLGAIFLAMAFSLMPAPGGWPLAAGLGGVIGDGVARGISALLLEYMTPPQITAGLIGTGLLVGMLFTGYAATARFQHVGLLARGAVKRVARRREPSEGAAARPATKAAKPKQPPRPTEPLKPAKEDD